jgi:hypothetical protein
MLKSDGLSLHGVMLGGLNVIISEAARMDGYLETVGDDGNLHKIIFQFHGCYWHGCPEHFPTNKDSEEDRYRNTLRLTELFRRSGYTVVEKWECKFREELISDREVKTYFDAHPTTRVRPLSLREALCGGRTSALRSYIKADLSKGETIKMVDVVSEYPNANLRGSYPYGHPTIHLEGDPDMPPIEQWNGVIKCTVLPPRDLFLPVLPYKSNGKLMFPLCRTCVETLNSDLCHHDDPVLRQITGVLPNYSSPCSKKGTLLSKYTKSINIQGPCAMIRRRVKMACSQRMFGVYSPLKFKPVAGRLSAIRMRKSSSILMTSKYMTGSF